MGVEEGMALMGPDLVEKSEEGRRVDWVRGGESITTSDNNNRPSHHPSRYNDGWDRWGINYFQGLTTWGGYVMVGNGCNGWNGCNGNYVTKLAKESKGGNEMTEMQKSYIVFGVVVLAYLLVGWIESW